MKKTVLILFLIIIVIIVLGGGIYLFNFSESPKDQFQNQENLFYENEGSSPQLENEYQQETKNQNRDNFLPTTTQSIFSDSSKSTSGFLAPAPSPTSVLMPIQTSSVTTSSNFVSESNIKYFTFEEVQKNNSRQSCWTIISGDVYDLTSWISRHPGGESTILNLCGKDGTQEFLRKHGGEVKPKEILEKFEIGKLKN